MQIRTNHARSPRVALLVTLALALVGCSTAQPAATPSLASPGGLSTATATPSATPTLTSSRAPSPVTRASTAPKPKAAAPSAAARASAKPATFRFPVAVAVGNATQVITVAAYGSYATVTAWQYAAGGWHRVLVTSAARVGANGVVPAAVRSQGTNTTPGGTFTLTQAFGIGANPGAHLAYHQVTSHDWWVEDNNSAYYNQMRTDTQGGFNMTLPENDVNGSEHLVTHTGTYQYAVVIDFNRWPAVHYKGAGIFLHVNGSGATAGCVSVPLSTMVALLRWLNPADHPRIAIG
jgi:L,D-peptidoglycan transpeptidase YkuD (ErfK/YbiS/YcfS/YnhG family)